VAINFPWEMFLQAQESKNRNRQDMNQNMASLGQNLGQGFNTIGQSIEERKKKQILDQIVQAMQSQGSSMQGPQMPPVA